MIINFHKRNLLPVAALCILFASCSPRIITQTETVRQIEHDTITTIERVPVEIQVPVEVHMAIADTTSFLETSVAESQAYVDSLGRLHHYIANKAVPLRDTIPVHHLEVRTVKQTTNKTIEVKPLTWWEEVKIDYGGYAVTLLAIAVLVIILMFRQSNR